MLSSATAKKSPGHALPGLLRTRGPSYPFVSDGRQLFLVTRGELVRLRRLSADERKRVRTAVREAGKGSR